MSTIIEPGTTDSQGRQVAWSDLLRSDPDRFVERAENETYDAKRDSRDQAALETLAS